MELLLGCEARRSDQRLPLFHPPSRLTSQQPQAVTSSSYARSQSNAAAAEGHLELARSLCELLSIVHPDGNETRYFSTKKLSIGFLGGHVWPMAERRLCSLHREAAVEPNVADSENSFSEVSFA